MGENSRLRVLARRARLQDFGRFSVEQLKISLMQIITQNSERTRCLRGSKSGRSRPEIAPPSSVELGILSRHFVADVRRLVQVSS